MQVSTLGLLMVSTLVIQGNWKELLDMLRYKSKPGGTADKSNNQGNHSSQNNFLLGVIPCLGATLLSGLAGAFSQNSLQCIEMPIFTLWRYRSFSAVCLFVPLCSDWCKSASLKQNQGCEWKHKI